MSEFKAIDYTKTEKAPNHRNHGGTHLAPRVNLRVLNYIHSDVNDKVVPAIFVNIIKNKNVSYENYVLDILLKDRTTDRNIIWATDDYLHLGDDFSAANEIVILPITDMIQCRTSKEQAKQNHRTRDKAEVFTPSWICNEQNNLIDDQWFGQKGVFNTQLHKAWRANADIITFPKIKGKSWEDYVNARRMEITCGEAPYLVSRYDAVTGEPIAIEDRIGFLDRKLRVVNENTDNFEDWFKWVQRAYQATYGYEFQGDSLLIARKNLLCTFVDNLKHKFNREPDISELKKIATIISWNIWQMDGLTNTIPLSGSHEWVEQLTLLDSDEKTCERKFCKIKDWRSKKIVEYVTLLRGRNNG